MKLTESQLRNLTRRIISELFTKKNPFSSKNTLDYEGGWNDSSFGYDEIGFGDDGGFAEGDDADLDELHEDEEEVE